MSPRRPAGATTIALLTLLSGCSGADPYTRPGMWQPEGVNSSNIAAMVERPSDLVRGRADRSTEIFAARDAVQRVWEDRARPLHGTTTSNSAALPDPNGKDAH